MSINHHFERKGELKRIQIWLHLLTVQMHLCTSPQEQTSSQTNVSERKALTSLFATVASISMPLFCIKRFFPPLVSQRFGTKPGVLSICLLQQPLIATPGNFSTGLKAIFPTFQCKPKLKQLDVLIAIAAAFHSNDSPPANLMLRET